MKTIAIIIVNWNGKVDTLACLESLVQDGYGTKHILVIDNGSSDDSKAAVLAVYPEVQVISAGANLGFTGGNNLGIARALEHGADYVLFLNNDTIVEADAIGVLIDAAESNPKAGLLTPVIHYFDEPGRPWFAGSEMDLRIARVVHENSSPPARTDGPKQIPWASGCAMLMPAAVLRQMGGFDDRFFLSWEDVDLCLRVRSAGHDILLVPAARIYHKVGRSFALVSGIGTYYYVRNQLLITRLHVTQARTPVYSRIVARHFRTWIWCILRRDPKGFRSLSIVVRAVCDFVRGRYGAVNAKGIISA